MVPWPPATKPWAPERKVGSCGAHTEAGISLVQNPIKARPSAFSGLCFWTETKREDGGRGGCALGTGSNQPHSPSSPRPRLSPQFTSGSPVPSMQLTTLLLPPSQPNGYQMHRVDLGQSGEEKLDSDKSAEKTQLGKANRAEEAAGKPSVQEPTCSTFPGAPPEPSSVNAGHMDATARQREELSTANQDSRPARGCGVGRGEFACAPPSGLQEGCRVCGCCKNMRVRCQEVTRTLAQLLPHIAI